MNSLDAQIDRVLELTIRQIEAERKRLEYAGRDPAY